VLGQTLSNTAASLVLNFFLVELMLYLPLLILPGQDAVRLALTGTVQGQKNECNFGFCAKNKKNLRDLSISEIFKEYYVFSTC